MKEYPSKRFLELGYFTESDIGKDKFDALVNASIPTKENFIRISSVVSLPSIFYNFKLQTKSKTAYFCIRSALGNTDDLWKFLELVTIGKYNILYYESPQEGPNSTLRVEKIDNKNIRFTLVSNRWLEHFWNYEKRTVQVNWAKFPKGGYNVNLDIIINKREFIYAFWLELWEIFNGDGSVDTIPEAISADVARKDSEIIRKYLGFVPATQLDKKLHKAIEDNRIETIRNLLMKGANPNAIIGKITNDTIFEDFLQTYCDNVYTNEFSRRCPKEDISEEESDAIEKTMLGFRDNMENDFFKIVKLMVKYGAKTTCFFPAIYNNNRNKDVITYLLDNNCVFDMATIECVATDSQHEETPDTYARMEKLYDDYLFSCSYKFDSKSDIIFHKPPEYYYWQGKKYETQNDWLTGNGKRPY